MMTDQSPQQGGQPLTDQLAKESRAQEARMLPHKGVLHAKHHKQVQDRLEVFIETSGLTLAQIETKFKCSKGVLKKFLARSDDHDDAFTRKVDRFVVQQTDGSSGGLPTKIVPTRVTEKMIAVLKNTNNRKTMCVIVGPSGFAKTMVLKACAAELIHGSVYIPLASTDRTPSPFLRAVSIAVGTPSYGSASIMLHSLVNELKGSDRLLMIDEAHYLGPKAANVLRDLHKLTECPIAMVGTDDILHTIDDFDDFHGQFKSLVSMTYNITDEIHENGRDLYTMEDVIAFAKECGLRLSTSGADIVCQLVNTLGWGGMRSAGNLLLNADLIRIQDNQQNSLSHTHINDKHIRATLRNMEGARGFKRTVTKMESTRRMAVAG